MSGPTNTGAYTTFLDDSVEMLVPESVFTSFGVTAFSCTFSASTDYYSRDPIMRDAVKVYFSAPCTDDTSATFTLRGSVVASTSAMRSFELTGAKWSFLVPSWMSVPTAVSVSSSYTRVPIVRYPVFPLRPFVVTLIVFFYTSLVCTGVPWFFVASTDFFTLTSLVSRDKRQENPASVPVEFGTFLAKVKFASRGDTSADKDTSDYDFLTILVSPLGGLSRVTYALPNTALLRARVAPATPVSVDNAAEPSSPRWESDFPSMDTVILRTYTEFPITSFGPAELLLIQADSTAISKEELRPMHPNALCVVVKRLILSTVYRW